MYSNVTFIMNKNFFQIIYRIKHEFTNFKFEKFWNIHVLQKVVIFVAKYYF